MHPISALLSGMHRIKQLRPGDLDLFRKLNAMFGDAFADQDTFGAAPPSDSYIDTVLAKEHVIALATIENESVVGGLVAYQLDKLERGRREISIYDLAVREDRRRQGIATALITKLRAIAKERNVWVIYVQADYGDDPAIA